MSEYGIKIRNYQAGSIHEVNIGIRNNYDCKDAMLSNSLFKHYMWPEYDKEYTRDIICIEFKYGSRTYQKDLNHIKKIAKQNRIDRKVAKSLNNKNKIGETVNRKNSISNLYSSILKNKDKYDKKSADELRYMYYEDGVDIRYPKFNRKKEIIGYDVIHYKMLVRSPR